MKDEEIFDQHNQLSISNLEKLFRRILHRIWEEDPENGANQLPPLMIWGAPGLGKSTVVRDLAREFGVGFIDVRLAQREPVDIRGLPVPRENGVEWLVSAECPRDPKSKGIIMFDELTAADRSLQVAAYEFILDRRLGNLYSVPPGWYICAAGNRITDHAVATTMSSALANRFMHVELQCDTEAWIQWAVAHEVHPSVTGFIRFRPELLFNTENENLERGWPLPRSWARVSSILNLFSGQELEELRYAVYGLVGNRAGVEFMAFHKINVEMDDVRALMLDPALPIMIPDKADRRYALCAAMIYYLWHGQTAKEQQKLLDGFFRISLCLPSDFAAMTMTDAMRARKGGAEILYKHPQYQEWLKRHGKAFARRR